MNNIHYASIRNLDISNGEGVGIAMFVQGCHFHCYNCFNPDTWDFNGGKEWTPKVEDKLIELANRPYIKRLSILGGEPLANENLDGVLHLVNRFRLSFPNKSIWIYSGFVWKDIMKYEYGANYINNFNADALRQCIVSKCDVLVDGRYIDSQRDITLKWRGSSNQRVIDIKSTLEKGNIVLWAE